MLKELTAEQIKKIAFDILLEVTNYCEKNNITYFLACGTLLGAVRHSGFIPWDDDIDIMMPRPDYNKFLDSYKGKYKLCKPSEGRYYYAKVFDDKTIKKESNIDEKKYKDIGVDIDIFPLDGIVNDERIVNKLYKKEEFLEMLLRLSNQPIFHRKNPLKAINRVIPRLIGSKNLVKMIESNAQTYKYEDSDYVVRMRRSTNGFTGALPKEVYEKLYMKFEGHDFCVPKGYDAWLTRFYGDYMVLPPIEKQWRHASKCYIKENE